MADITGTPGNDTLNGTSGDDSIIGLEGNDTINGGDGNDQLYGETGNDTLNGGNGADVLSGWFGDDILTGGAGADDFRPGLGNDVIMDYQDGVDLINLFDIGFTGFAHLMSFAQQVGNNVVITATIDEFQLTRLTIRNVTLAQLNESDFFFHTGPGATIAGTEGDDLLYGLGGDFVITHGFGGNDTIVVGPSGFDRRVNGGDGDDTVILTDPLSSFIIMGQGGTDTLVVRLRAAQQVDNLSQTYTVTLNNGGQQDLRGFENLRLESTAGTRLTVFVDLLNFDMQLTHLIGGAGADTVVSRSYNGLFPTLSFTNWSEDDTFEYQMSSVDTDLALSGIHPGLFHIVGSNLSNSITGTDSLDWLEGASGDDTLIGNGGDDRLDGGFGADVLRGGEGNDRLGSGDGGAPSDQSSIDLLEGGNGDDWLAFGFGDNVSGGAGFDVAELSYAGLGSGVSINLADLLAGVSGANGGGTVTGVEGVATIYGSAFDDSFNLAGAAVYVANGSPAGIFGGDGNDTIVGSDANERLVGGTGSNILYGAGGNDILDGRFGTDILSGGQGDDVFLVSGQDDLIREDPNGGMDQVWAFGSFYLYDQLEQLLLIDAVGDVFGVGNALDNHIVGNGGNNLLIGGGGADQVLGGAGSDALFGESGDDQLYGEGGVDYLVGGIGADRLYGGDNPDALYGEAGDDILDGGDSFDTDILVGGDGDDWLDGDSGQANADYDLLDGGAGNDLYLVDSGDDLTFEAADGGYDTVYADVRVPNGGVYLYANVEGLILLGTTAFGVGNELNNSLQGSASGNWLLGGAGNDGINGRQGNDVLFGEAGADYFVFQAGDGQDVIGDFTAGVDVIELRGIYSSFAEVQAAFHQNGADGAIDLGGGNLLVLQGVTLSTLTAADFNLIPVSEPQPAKAPPVMEAPAWTQTALVLEDYADHALNRWQSPLHEVGWLL